MNRFTQTCKKENGTRVTITDPNRLTEEVDNMTNGRPPDKYTSTTHITPDIHSMQFNEIKSLKRVHKVHEGIGTEDITDIPGIVNPYTGEIMTVRDAIASRILDVRTGKIVASPDGTQITINEAANAGLIQPRIAEKLFSPCGVTEEGHSLTLLEAIQREIYEAEHGFLDPSEKRLKVMHSTTINQAIDDGIVDIKTGKYQLGNGESITITEAYQKGYLLQQTEVKIKTGAVSLYDAINQGLVDNRTGWVVDRNSGNKYQIDAAVNTNVIDGNVREIVDPKTDSKITVSQALEKGVINPKLGKYALSYEKLPLVEAKRRQLIIKPLTLKDVVDLNLIDKDGNIASPLHQSKLNILEAISCGVLDSNSIKSVLHSGTGQYLTLNEAIAHGIIYPDCTFRDALTGEILSIPEAVHRGYITSVAQKSIFDIDGFQPPDKSDYISFNAAQAKGYISKNYGGSLVTNLKSGKLISFADGVKSGEIKPEVYEMLTRKIGIFENGVELTVLEAVFKGYVDPSSGNFIDIRKNVAVPLNDAIAQNLITPEGAALLNSLLTISVTTHTTSKVVQRYVTYTKSEEAFACSKMTYTDALQRGLIDNQNQTYTDPETKQIIPINQALNEGKICPDTEAPTKSEIERTCDKQTATATIKIIQLQQEPMEVDSSSSSHVITACSNLPTLSTETKVIQKSDPKTITSNFLSSEKHFANEKQLNELPAEGWMLSDAISQNLLDPVAGLFVIPGTDRLVSFEECVNLKIINPTSAVVVDPTSKRKISLSKSIDRKILDATGHYVIENSKVNMKEAIEKGFVILENKMEVEPGSQRILQVTKEGGQPARVEVKISPDTSYLDPVRLESGSIYDPSSTLIVHPDTGQSENILEAIENKKINPELIKVIHPKTGETIDINEAIQMNIIDKNTGEYTDKTGNKISLQDAAKFGILTVIGAPIVGAKKMVEFVHKIIDPQTGEPLSVDEAVEKGLISKEYCDKLKTQALINDAKQISEQVPVELTHVTATISDSQQVFEGVSEDPEKYKNVKFLDTATIDLGEGSKPSPGEQARVRITVEPKYTVTIGRGQSVSPEREAKRVVLQKLRKRAVKPKYAVEKGIIDDTAAKLLDAKTFETATGEAQTLQDALDAQKVDGDQGKIVDPQRGDLVTINEAISRGILDPNGTNEIILPLNRSLSVPELYEQGLIDPATGKVIHPETGAYLNLSEAVVCDILDPLSVINTPSGKKITLEEALQRGDIDVNDATIKTEAGSLDLETAIKTNVFDKETQALTEIPPAGMTFEVALKRGLIDPETKEVIHPITKERKPLSDAIKENFIMALPFPPVDDGVDVEQAIDSNLIDFNAAVFRDPKTQEIVPISEAIESGRLIIDRAESEKAKNVSTSITEAVTTVHTVTTKTIELLCGYILLNTEQVQNTSTGEIMSIEEARLRGIIVDENETKRTTALTFTEAVNKGLVDLKSGTYTDPTSRETISVSDALKQGILEGVPNASEYSPIETMDVDKPSKVSELDIATAINTIYKEDSGKFVNPEVPENTLTLSEALQKEVIDSQSLVYDVRSQMPVTLEQAVDSGLIDSDTGKVKDIATGKSYDFKEAAKKGLIAVLGGLAAPVALPVLAGAAAVKAIKDFKDKNQKTTPADSDQTKESVASIELEKPKTIDTKKEQIIPVAKQVSSLEHVDSVDEITFERMTIRDAIALNKITPEVCRIMRQKHELSYTVEDGLLSEEISQNDVIEVINRNLINIISQQPKFLKISKAITPQKLAELGYYELETNSFIDPETCEAVSFEDFTYTVGVFDPDSILVRDLSKEGQVYVSLHEAVRRPLINASAGYMVDKKTGKRVPFFEAVKIKWIIDVADRPKPRRKPLTFEEVVHSNNINAKSLEITVPETNEVVQFAEALDKNIVNPNTVTIRDPKNLELIPYHDAVDQHVVDPHKGVIVNTATQIAVQFPEAFYLGYILSLPRPISLQAVIDKGMYDTQTCKISDPLTKQLLPLGEAVDRRIIDDQISEVKDTKADEFVTLHNALITKIVDPDSGKLLNTLSGELIPLNIALDQNLIQTKPLILSLLQAILLNYYSPSNGQILNPATGDEISLAKAIEYNLIDPATTKIKDDKRQKIVEINEAIERNLVDPEKGILTTPLLTLDQAYAKGYILSTVLPWSLQEALAFRIYDPSSGQFTFNNENKTLAVTIDENIINPNVLTVKDPSSNVIITLGDAISGGLIEPQRGVVIDPVTNSEVNLYEASDRGIIVPYKKQITLPEAVFKGFYDPNTGKIINPQNKQKIDTGKAIDRGYIDPTSTLVKLDEEIVTFEKAVDQGRVDTKSGTITLEQQQIDFAEAFIRDYLIEIHTPMCLSEAIAKHVYDPETQLFLDPQSGNYLTLMEAIEANVIDPGSVHVKDTRTGVWRKLTLIEAIDTNYVDRNTGKVKDYSKGESFEVTLTEAFDLGILVDNKVAVSLQRAIHQGLYDEKSGKIIDPNTERKITLHEAIRKFIINPLLPCYYSKKDNKLINLTDTCRLGIIDKLNGTFKEPDSDAVLTFSDALNLGLIVDIETANFGLYEAIEMGLYSETENEFKHPATDRKYNLRNACVNELVNPVCSLVKDMEQNRYVQLPLAIERQLINDELNEYNLPNGSRINLSQAKQRGLIVTVRRLLTLEEVINNYLYRPESAKFVDPVGNEYYDLAQALDNGFIDSTTTAFKDPSNNALKALPLAIYDGNVDVEKARVLDPKTKKTYNLDVAFEKGLLVTLHKPLIQEVSVKTIIPESASRPIHECSLDEAIKFELINPEEAVVKDLHTGKFLKVSRAIDNKQLESSKVVVFDPNFGKIRSQIVTYDQNTPIYHKEPLTFEQAIELGSLNIITGQFTVPQSNEILSIKDSFGLGYIDPDSALVKDTNKKKLIKLPEAFRRGLADAEKGNILDSASSKLYSLANAIDVGLLTTPKQGFSLIESLEYGLYNPVTGGFNDPFCTTSVIDRKRLTLSDAIANNLIDPSSTVVKDTENGAVVTLLAAIDNTLVDAIGGRLHDKNDNKDIDFIKARERGLILPAEQRVSTFLFLSLLVTNNIKLTLALQKVIFMLY